MGSRRAPRKCFWANAHAVIDRKVDTMRSSKLHGRSRHFMFGRNPTEGTAHSLDWLEFTESRPFDPGEQVWADLEAGEPTVAPYREPRDPTPAEREILAKGTRVGSFEHEEHLLRVWTDIIRRLMLVNCRHG